MIFKFIYFNINSKTNKIKIKQKNGESLYERMKKKIKGQQIVKPEERNVIITSKDANNKAGEKFEMRAVKTDY